MAKMAQNGPKMACFHISRTACPMDLNKGSIESQYPISKSVLYNVCPLDEQKWLKMTLLAKK